VTTVTWRTSVRTLGGSFALGVAAAAVMGGIGTPAEPASIAVFASSGVELATQYAMQDARITATPEATWTFAAPAVSVDVPEPTVIAPRPVASHPAPPSVAGNAILEEAAKYVGTPYLYGGTTPAGFDCTGFVMYVFAQFGISLPHASSAYWNLGTRVSAADARPGDLIVSSGHVAIYAGNGMEIDSPRAGKTIQFRAIWQTSYVFVRVS
jgi:cell wall-associated NlpC family hydrolase